MAEGSIGEDIVKQIRTPDCEPCRITGTVTFFGIGTYLLYITKTAPYYANCPLLKRGLQAAGFG